MEWALTRAAGVVMLLGFVLPAIPSVAVLATGGSVEAGTAMFRDLSYGVGQVGAFKVSCAGYAAWAVFTLVGFVLLALAFWERGERVLPALIVVFMTLYAFIVAAEATFHYSVTSWAIQLTESGSPVPDIYFQLKRWLNVTIQVAINPLAMLAFVGCGWAVLRTGLLPSWAGWSLIVYGALFTFIPLPLLIVPIPFLLGLLLVVKG